MFSNKLHVFFGGSVGVGKSSVIDSILGLFDSNTIFWVKEYIDADEAGERKLNLFLTGKFDVLSFQRYVLGQTRKQVVSDDYVNARVILWERHPMESLLFMGLCLKNGTCTETEYKTFEEELRGFCKFTRIPPLNKDAQVFNVLPIDTSEWEPHAIAQIVRTKICHDLCTTMHIPSYVFLLCSKVYVQYERIHSRGRECEVKKYKDVSDVKALNKEYYEFIISRLPRMQKWKDSGLISFN